LDKATKVDGEKLVIVEVEYRGVANVVSKSCWHRNILLEPHCHVSEVTMVYYDNVSLMYIFSNLTQHRRTKHTTDIFTKSLSQLLFDDFLQSLNIQQPYVYIYKYIFYI